MDQVNQAVSQAQMKTINAYNGSTNKNTGSFPKFVAQHYQKNKGSSHGDTMRNISKQYKNTTFYK